MKIVDQDEAISQVIASTETAMAMCRNRNMEREAELLKARRRHPYPGLSVWADV